MITNFPDVRFKVLRDELGLALGMDGDDGQITDQFARQIARALNVATRYAWRVYPWEEVCPVLKELEHDYVGNILPVCAPGYEVLRVWSENPETAFTETEDTYAKEIPFAIGRRGNIVLSEATTTPYYLVRIAPPHWGTAAWDDTTNYQPGDVIYDTTVGDCYAATRGNLNSALPTSFEPWAESSDIVADSRYLCHGAVWLARDNYTIEEDLEPGIGVEWANAFFARHEDWAPQRLPLFLKEAVLAGAEAWLQRTMEGQPASMAVVKKVMDELLEIEVASRWATRRQYNNGSPLILQ